MGLTRRDFCRSGVSALGVVGAPFSLGGGAAFAAERPAQQRLVVLMLRGAVDMLNVVAPWRDPAYAAARPSLALKAPGQPGGALDLDGNFGLHPALAALTPLWSGRRLAVVQACGSPDLTRSHFDAQRYMETGRPGSAAADEGWMNRLLRVVPGSNALTRAVSVGPTRPMILAGSIPTSALRLEGGDPGKAKPIDRPGVSAAFSQLYEGRGAMGEAFRQGVEARRELMSELQPDPGKEDPTASAGAPSAAGFPQTADHVARLLRHDDRIQFVFLDLGGWDTHVGQGAATGALAQRLKPLGDGLAHLATALGRDLDRTMIVVMTEFGRTVRENGGGGTDHGHGAAMWLIGGAVAGGKIHGRWPGLDASALHQGRDLAVTTDFRAVLAQVMTRHLRVKDAQLAELFPAAPKLDGDGLRLF